MPWRDAQCESGSRRTPETRPPSAEEPGARLAGSSLFLGLDLLDRPTGLLPGAEAAFQVCDGGEPHVLRGPGGERRTPGAGAEEHELVAGLEIILGVRTLRVDPHLQHAARDIDGAGDRAVAPQLARIADVDEGNARLADELDGFADRHGLDLS